MKPILLKIAGLNSFTDEQTIDFEKLCEKRLFGIFGATGSGKSTVLDAITLALYNKTARNTDDFINDTSTEARVFFKFEIALNGIRHIYNVERFYKRKTNGSIKAHKARLYTDEGAVLADKINSVTEKMEEIIGLNYEDFSRSVVLPQGKFSEFLMLKGSKKRDMLERIFSLEQYGEKLGERLKRRKNTLYAQINALNTKLDALGNVTPENVESLEKSRQEAERLSSDAENKLKTKRKDLYSAETAFKIKIEYDRLVAEYAELESKKPYFEKAQKKLEGFKKAEKVLILIESKNDAAKKYEAAAQSAQKLESERLKADDESKNAELALQSVKSERDVLYPKLLAESERLKNAKSVRAQIVTEENERKKLLEEFKRLKAEQNRLTQAITANDEKIKSLENEIKTDMERGKNQRDGLKDELRAVTETIAARKNSLDEFIIKKQAFERANKAVALANGLAEGEQCPVCGSTHHPKLARFEESDEFLKDTEEILKNEIRRLETERQKKEKLADALNDKLLEISSEKYGKAVEKNSLLKNTEAYRKKLEEIISEKSGVEERGKEKRRFIDAKNQEIAEITGGKPFDDALAQNERAIERLSSKLADAEQRQKALSDAKNDALNRLTAAKKERDTLKNMLAEQDKRLVGALKQNGFSSAEEATALYMPEKDADKLAADINLYSDNLKETAIRLEELKKQAENITSVTAENVEKLRNEVAALERQESENKKRAAVLAQQKQTAENALSETKSLTLEKAEIDKKLAAVTELARVTEGKKLVEFMATARLKSIADEASVRLCAISRQRYKLMLIGSDFAIFDALNGGNPRYASTLSGGEVFLVSFALALALSSNVQMKNSASLDFFFLDEGFGSLDSQLADLVMDSLERLGDERLTVGLITHIEALKDRVPIRLEITSPQPGEGSKAAIKI